MSRNALRSALMVFALCLTLSAAVSARAETLKLLSSWPENMIFVTGAVTPFKENLKKFSDAGLDIEYFGPDVIPAMEQLQPLEAGVFDLLYTIPAYHMGATAVGAAVDAIQPGPERLRQTGIFDYIDKQYNQRGLKLIAIVPITDLHFLTRVPLEERKTSFDGLKIRTTPTVNPLVKELGGAPVNLPSGEVYTALQKGVIDGATIITFGALDLKWYEVTKYMVRPTFGNLSTLILMNLEKYKALSPEKRQALDQAGAQTELDAMQYFKDKKEAEQKELIKLGLKETQMKAEDGARADQIYQNTLWTLTEGKSGEAVKKLHELARKNGLTQ